MTLRTFDIDINTQVAWRMGPDGQMFCTIFVDNIKERMKEEGLFDDALTVGPIEWPVMLRLASAILNMEHEFNYDSTSYRPENWDDLKDRMKKYLGVVE